MALNLFAFALALALIGAVIFLWAVSGKMVFARSYGTVTGAIFPISRLKTRLRLITSKERNTSHKDGIHRIAGATDARLNGGRFGYGYAWLVSQCTAVLSQARVATGNSARTSTADAHALKLLATQRGNVRSSNIATDSRGIFGPTTVQVPRKGFLESL